jgi:hypothetical protein
LFSIQDNAKWNRAYRAQLHRIGAKRIRERLDALEAQYEADLALCCFEHDPAQCHRSQISAVLGEQIFDLALIVSRRGDYVALCHEVDQ